MAISPRPLTTCLWFDTQAEEAAKFYCGVFKNAQIGKTSYYGKEGFEVHGQKEGEVMTVAFELEGQSFVALNGGPQFKFTEAISFQIHCADQQEIDYYWSKLSADGGSEGPCGWLKDKFGLSWQVIPTELIAMITDPDTAKSQRVTKAFLRMRKFDLAELRRAFNG